MFRLFEEQKCRTQFIYLNRIKNALLFCVATEDHLSRAFANLEYRLLNEINHLRAMINLVLPPTYQQQYFAQAQPQLYEPLPASTPSPSPITETPPKPDDTTKSWSSMDSTNSVQNESPLAVLYDNVTSSIQDSSKKPQYVDELVSAKKNSATAATTTMPMSTTATTTTTTEKILHFRPVQKKSDGQLGKNKK